MQVVYDAENLIDAHLVRGRLDAEGIPAFVRGEFLCGAMGELPVGGLLAVCVDDDRATEAVELIRQWREAAAEPVGDDPFEDSAEFVSDGHDDDSCLLA